MKHIKSRLLQTAAFGTSAACLILASAQARAASVSSVTITNVGANGSVCLIDGEVIVTGTNGDDGGTIDFIHLGGEDSSGNRYNAPAVVATFVGTTSTVNRRVNITSTNAPRDTYLYVVRDATTQATNGARGPIIASAAVPRSSLVAAGGGCAQIAVNSAPVSNAGADQNFATGGAAVTLNGTTSSDADGDTLTYQWVQVSGPAVTLGNANSASPTFSTPAQTNRQQDFVFELQVSDGIELIASSLDTVTISTAAGPNTSPIPDAGPDASVGGGSTVTLDGTGSADADNDPLTYSWSQISGPTVTLSNTAAASPTFTAPPTAASNQVLTFALSVDDGFGASPADTVEITVLSNATPTADAGNDVTFPGGSLITLEGAASDPENDPLTYQWAQVSGTAVTLNNDTTLNPSFTAPPKASSDQILTFSLVASDGTSSSAPDTVDVTISANVPEVADAGVDQTVNGSSVVTLDATGSTDGDGDPLTFAWSQTAGPAVTLSDPSSATPTFTAPASSSAAQTLSFSVIVSDGVGRADADDVDIVVTTNAPPVADAGADQGPIDSGQTVTLNGTASSDPNNDTLTYIWTQVSGTQVTLIGGSSASPTFTAPLVNGSENLVFELVVNDGQVASPPDQVTIAVRAVGSITIFQRVIGDDTTVAFTSNVAALNSSVTTSGGTATLAATAVAAGSYSLSVQDLTGQGYALNALECNDSDSAVNLAGGSIALALSPSEDLVCTVTLADTRSAAQAAIRDFLSGRNALLLSNQPDLQRRIDRLHDTPAAGGSVNVAGMPVPGSGSLPLAMQLGGGNARLNTSLAMAASATGDINRRRKVDLWTDVTYADVTFGQNQGSFLVGYLGVDVLTSSDMLIGALVQVDRFNRDGGVGAVGSVEGNGWMAGPYITARLSPRLYADARVAYGKSDNSISPLGTFVDGFDTERLLFSSTLVGDVDLGDKAKVWPELSVRYIREKQGAYVDSLDVTIPGQTVDQGEIVFSPRFDYRLDMQSGWNIRPYAEFEGLLTFGATTNTVIDNGLRGRIEGGVDAASPDGIRLNLTGFYDGIGESAYEAVGVSVGVSFRF